MQGLAKGIEKSINRIRLEFKVVFISICMLILPRINRIRLEFKDGKDPYKIQGIEVLIESDWNLKNLGVSVQWEFFEGINRIRLEFKGHKKILTELASRSINRIRLEFKGE